MEPRSIPFGAFAGDVEDEAGRRTVRLLAAPPEALDRLRGRAINRVLRVALLSLGAAGCDSSTGVGGPVPVPPGLWTASGEPAAVVCLTPSQLRDGGAGAPCTTLTTSSAGLGTLNSLAFADDGTLWVASADDSLLLAFAPEALATTGNRIATRVISPSHGSLAAPTGLAFDADHGLWVANSVAGTLARYAPEQLAAGGAPEPQVVISGLDNPTALAFDPAGALWVSENRNDRLLRYDAATLTTSGAPAPAVTLSSSGGCLGDPVGLAFDRDGNLWVATPLGCGRAIAYGSEQLRASGSPVPRVVLTGDSTTIPVPVGLAFDADGDLWVAGLTGILAEFARASLGSSGAPSPSARIEFPRRLLLWGLAFWPRPPGLLPH